MNKLIEFFAKQGVFADLLTVAIFIVGIGSVLTIQREVFPNVDFETITVTTTFPGASPTQVEKLVTNTIERELKEVDGIKKLTSVSTESQSVIVAQLDPDETDSATGKQDIKDAVDRITTFPEDIEEPLVNDIKSTEQPIITASISGDPSKLTQLELRNTAKRLKEELEDLKEVARISTKGLLELEVKVEASPQKLSQYGLSLADLISALRLQNINIPGGTIEAIRETQEEVIIRTIGEFENIEDVQNTVIRANELGRAVRVKDVAKVSFGLVEKPASLSKTDGEPMIGLVVIKKAHADVIDTVDRVKARLNELKPTLQDGVSIHFVDDSSYYTRRRLKILTNNLSIGLILVLVILTLILPVRVALLVSIGIPFAFLGTLIVFSTADISLNLITMMGLIIVIGMLVDDAIVVTDNAVRFIEEGMPPEEAALKGTQQVWGPVLAAVLTTIVAFLPLVFMSGIFGKFVRNLPLGVIIGLIMSVIECFLVLPHHIGRWIRFEKRSLDTKKKGLFGRILAATEHFWDQKITPGYVRLLKVLVKRRYITCLGSFAFFATASVFAVSKIGFVLFPPEGVEIFFIRTQAPIGTSIEKTSQLIIPIENEVGKLSSTELKNFVTDIGIQRQDPNDPNTKRGSEYAQIIVYLTPETERKRTANQIIEELREKVGSPPGLELVRFDRVNPGPPVGKPISVGVRGKNYPEILPAVADVKALVETIEGTSDIEDTYSMGKKELQIELNSAETSAAGLSVGTVGTVIRSAYEGVVATSIKKLDEEIDIRVTTDLESRSKKETLERLFIRNPLGNLVPLSRIAKISEDQGIAYHQHENNRRQVRVLGQIDNQKTNATAVSNLIKEKVPELMKKHPTVTFHFGGEDEDTQESMISLFRALALAVLSIFLILVLTFKNLLQPILVLFISLPLGIIAVILAFFLHGMPISFLGSLGIIGLAGVIVNNSIVFTDFVNQHRKAGMDKLESILQAGKIRIRPIFLTTITTVFGVLPTAYGIGGLDQFVVPVAMALGWGMFFGSILTTFIFPPALAIMDDLGGFLSRKKKSSPPLQPVHS